ncbi:hypothetical protein AB9P05_09525 [Roseivirga sp. BDSF3-8]|uniref:hypothetical protein n=1 Tax=Roseivirga sp. BDSF3-8 TaxID=3241598 RepID=UPI003531C728
MRNKAHYFLVLLLNLTGLYLSACSSDEEPYPRFPVVTVYEEVYLDNPILQADLDNPSKRFVYLNAGINGIILHKTIDERYIALERLSPVDVDADCTVNVDVSGFFIDDPCSDATWDLEGNPSGGGNAWPLYQYQTSRTGQGGNYLIITN